MICQSRRVEKDCDSSFVDGYNAQAPNPVYRAPMNAPRNSSILRCRGDEYCNDPHLGYSPTVQDGVPYYCVFASSDILVKIREFEWIDDLTSEVFVSSFIYFSNADAISLMRFNFQLLDTGRIAAESIMNTHSVLQDTSRWSTFLMLQTAFLMLVSAQICHKFVKSMRGQKRFFSFDGLLLLMLGAFGAVDLLSKVAGEDTTMTGLLDLLHQILDVDDPTSRATVEMAINGSFDTLGVIKTTVARQEMMKLIAYVIVFMCLLRLIQYMEVHPRIDLIARTVKTAAGDMFHFFLIFLSVFSILAWLAHWSFGPDKIMFSTFQTSVNTCFQMLIGEYPFEDEWTEGWPQKIWYVLYTFLLFLVSLNILLAIIVESFLRVKQETDERREVRSICQDMFCLAARGILSLHYGWPSTRSIVAHIEATRLGGGSVSAKELAYSEHAKFTSQEAATEFMRFYHWFLGPCILDTKGREFEEYRKFVVEYMTDDKLRPVLSMNFRKFMQVVVRIQSAIRRRLAVKRARQLRQKQDRRSWRSEEVADLQSNSDDQVREFASRLRIQPQIVEALLLVRGSSSSSASAEELNKRPLGVSTILV